jgi:hypothetical protein
MFVQAPKEWEAWMQISSRGRLYQTISTLSCETIREFGPYFSMEARQRSYSAEAFILILHRLPPYNYARWIRPAQRERFP